MKLVYTSKNRKTRPWLRPAVAGTGLLLLAILFFVLAFFSRSALPAQADSAIPQATPRPAQTAETAESAETAECAPTPDPDAGFLDPTAYGDAVLAETEDGGDAYIENTLFIGDSNTVRYQLYGLTDLANNIGVTSMGVGSITSLACVDFNIYAQLVTIPKAIALIQPQRVIFGFGSNNLGGGSAQAMVRTYQRAIETCYNSYPYFTVIVNSIPPLGQNRSNRSLTQSDADAYNAALAQMCQDNGWYFLDSAAALKDPDTGWAKSGYTLSDGLHLSEEGAEALFDYIRTHTMEEADRRPKPLNSIPSHNKTPDGLIGDPISAKDSQGNVNVPVVFRVEGSGWIDGETNQSVAKGGTSSTVTAQASEGWHFDHWAISLSELPSSTSASLTISVPSTADANGVIATAYFVEDAPLDENGQELWPDVYGALDASQYCGYCGHAGHSYDLCPRRQAEEG